MSSRTLRAAAGVVAVLLLAAAGAFALLQRPASSTSARPAAVASTPAGGSALSKAISALQQKLRDNPHDAASLAALGIDYVQQAKATVDPSYYPKAQGVLTQSLAINSATNVQAMAGQSALESGQHHFADARRWAQRGLKLDPYSATLYGALNDADTQLGRYDEAFTAAQKMLDLHPGVPAYTRAEYVFELRGQIPQARSVLERALSEATEPADKSFALYYLGELAFGGGDYAAALRQSEAALAADPSSAAALEGKGRAEAALGQTAAAVRDYADVTQRLPLPQYLLEYGALLESLGRTAEAQQQYSLFEAENKIFQANGVTLDTDPTLYYAGHRNAKKALAYGKVGMKARPFIEMEDAYAWALHAAGRDRDALVYAKRAARLGTRSALFDYHRGMIEKSLGQRAAALTSLRAALSTSPAFDPLEAPRAKAAVASLAGS